VRPNLKLFIYLLLL